MERLLNSIFSCINPRIKPAYWVIAAVIVLFAGLVMEYYRRRKRVSKAQSISAVLLITYIFLVFASTVFSRTSNSYYSYKLIPFWSYREILAGSKSLFWQCIFNVIMLVPLGILEPVVLGDGKKADRNRKYGGRVVLTGFLISVTIEVLQLIMKRGLFEFDDIFHNTIGAAIGYGIYKGIRKIYRRT